LSVDTIIAIAGMIATIMGATGALVGVVFSNKLVNHRLDRIEDRLKNLAGLADRVLTTELEIKNIKELKPKTS